MFLRSCTARVLQAVVLDGDMKPELPDETVSVAPWSRGTRAGRGWVDEASGKRNRLGAVIGGG
jgi:hypothetical protein